MVVLLSIAIDPFTQQITRPYTCSTTIGGQAFVSTANQYDSLDSTLQERYIYSALNSPTKKDLNADFGCPTGNCIFPSRYRSIGVSSRCFSAENKLRGGCQNHTDELDDSGEREIVSCNWTLPSGVGVTRQETVGSSLGYYAISVGNATSPMSTDCYGNGSSYTAARGLACVQFLDGSPENGLGDPAAMECHLFPSINEYSGNVTAGALGESLASVLPMQSLLLPSNDHLFFTTVQTSCLPAWQQEEFRRAGYIQNGSEWFSWDGTLLYYEIPPSCVYDFGMQTISYMQDMLSRFLSTTPMLNETFDGQRRDFDDIESNLTMIAKSLTVDIRNSQLSEGSGGTSGHVVQNETCLGVQWAWTVVPITLIIATIAFVILIIRKTSSQRHRQNWKSSSLALLFNGLDTTTRNNQGLVDQWEDMDKAAKSMLTKLEHTEAGWRFVQQDR